MRVLLVGAPGAGKGTQGKRIAERYSVPHVSSGELLRANVDDGTELGRAAQPSMDSGGLVPDELVLAMLRERIDAPDASRGYVLDGIPRNHAQAEELSDLALDAVICLDVPHDELVRRLHERGREDDDADTVEHRIEVYNTETQPMLDFYEGKGSLHRVDADGPVETVTARICAVLAKVIPA
ncbi:adenylate kinase family protein [Flindersiella endophytica]